MPTALHAALTIESDLIAEKSPFLVKYGKTIRAKHHEIEEIRCLKFDYNLWRHPVAYKTRKLCYSKDDRAMRAI